MYGVNVSLTCYGTLWPAALGNNTDKVRSSQTSQATGIKPEEWYADSVNTNFIKNPLRKMDNLKFDEWWFHGLRGATPDQVMELPAG